jgi:4'-phosphopantetheinyl transferase
LNSRKFAKSAKSAVKLLQMTNLSISRSEPIDLGSDEVHVWHARLDQLAEQQPELDELLSEEERVRANRYCFLADRNRFILARGILRSLLAAYTGSSAAEIDFIYAGAGKPGLDRPADTGLQFNLSHSHGFAAYAFARGRRLGIDVELVRAMRDADAIVERYFSPQELAAYRALPVDARQRGFFNGWVRKEAFVKALGAGLGHPLSEFSVSLAPSEPARFVGIPSDQAAAGWRLSELNFDPAYAAAVVADNGEFRVVSRGVVGLQ